MLEYASWSFGVKCQGQTKTIISESKGRAADDNFLLVSVGQTRTRTSTRVDERVRQRSKLDESHRECTRLDEGRRKLPRVQVKLDQSHRESARVHETQRNLPSARDLSRVAKSARDLTRSHRKYKEVPGKHASIYSLLTRVFFGRWSDGFGMARPCSMPVPSLERRWWKRKLS